MPTYRCNYDSCRAYNNLCRVDETTIRVMDGEIEDSAAPCPECGRDRKTVKVDGYTTQIHGSMNIPI